MLHYPLQNTRMRQSGYNDKKHTDAVFKKFVGANLQKNIDEQAKRHFFALGE